MITYVISFIVVYFYYLLDKIFGRFRINTAFIRPSLYTYNKLLKLKKGVYKDIKIRGYLCGIFNNNSNKKIVILDTSIFKTSDAKKYVICSLFSSYELQDYDIGRLMTVECDVKITDDNIYLTNGIIYYDRILLLLPDIFR